MTRFFLDVINLSIAGSWLILAVIAIRFLFKKRVPKWVNCLLWSFVGIRLILPFTLESAVSLAPNREIINIDAVYGEVQPEPAPPVQSEGQTGIGNENNNTQNDTEDNQIIPNGRPVLEFDGEQEYFQSGIEIFDDRINPVINGTVSSVSPSEENPLHNFLDIASCIWLAGTVMLFTYAAINYFLLKRRVATAIPYENNARRCDRINTPFILGVFRPKIYLPFGLSPATEESVVAHENAHLRRKDHLIKPIAYLILSVYWFNPLMWVAYILLCRDIESACDEKVIKEMDTKARQAYATALLECSVAKSTIAACPLAFGEIGVKDRVKNTMRYKKPAMWIIISAVVVCVFVSVLFLTSPDKTDKNDTNESDDISEEISQIESSIVDNPATDFEYESFENGIKITKYIGTTASVSIPLQIDGKDVISIGEEAFSGSAVEKVVMKDAVTEINNSAFANCANLEEVVLSANLKSIGENAFIECQALNKISLPESLETIERACFQNCTSLTDITVPGNVVNISEFSFFFSGLTNVELKAGIKTIGAHAFTATKLTNVTLPVSVKTIGNGAFAICPLTEVNLNEGLEEIGKEAFQNNLYLNNIYIPSTVKNVTFEAFSRCDNLYRVYFYGDAPKDFDLKLAYKDNPEDKPETTGSYTVYYLKGAKGFSPLQWCGYKTKIWENGEANNNTSNKGQSGNTSQQEKPSANEVKTYFPEEFFELSRMNTGKAEFDITVAHSYDTDRVPGYINFIDTDAIAQNWKLTVTVSENIRCFAFIEVDESVAHKIGRVLYVHDTTLTNGPLLLHTYINDVSANRGLCYITGDGEVVYYSFGCNMNTGEVGYGKDVYNLGSTAIGVYRPDITGNGSERQNHDVFEHYFENFLRDKYRTEWSYVGVTEGKYKDPANNGYTKFDVYRVVQNGREDFYAVPYDSNQIEEVYKFQFDNTMIPVWIKPAGKQLPDESQPPVEVHTHDYTDTIVEATCVASGYTEHKCACGNSYKDTFTDKKIYHDFQKTRITEGTLNYEAYSCSMCGLIACAHGNVDGNIKPQAVRYYITRDYYEGPSTLVIYGKGDIPDFSADWEPNWTGKTGYYEIENIIISEGITGIGAYNFNDDYARVKNIIIADTVETIGYHAMYSMNYKGIVKLGGGVEILDSFALPQNCSGVYVPSSLKITKVLIGGMDKWIYYQGTEEQFKNITYYSNVNGNEKLYELLVSGLGSACVTYSAW